MNSYILLAHIFLKLSLCYVFREPAFNGRMIKGILGKGKAQCSKENGVR